MEAVILHGIGSARSRHFHIAGARLNQTGNDFIKGEKTSDIVNINGYIIEGTGYMQTMIFRV
jgi:hypothetical protein